ncbi:MAG: hypothetical protein QMD94_00590, partial [Candidatus Omnitrophota bacterium]|nr:hypothetical protein [Candidatus Omnitrophota bacterium]
MKEPLRKRFIFLGFCLVITGLLFMLFSGDKDKKVNSVSSTTPRLAFEPAYLKLHKTGELKKRAEELWNIMKNCRLCPRQCGVNRLAGEKGFCQATSQAFVASYHPHFGEEKPLVGKRGSGTIFFTNCGLRCVFCINWQISQGGEGKATSIEE